MNLNKTETNCLNKIIENKLKYNYNLYELSLMDHFNIGKQIKHHPDTDMELVGIIRSKLDDVLCSKFESIPDDIILNIYYGSYDLDEEEIKKVSLIESIIK